MLKVVTEITTDSIILDVSYTRALINVYEHLIKQTWNYIFKISDF